MKFTNSFLFLLFILSLKSESFAKTNETIPVIGTDAEGKAQVLEVPKSAYVQRLSLSATTMNDSLMDAFNEVNMTSATAWHLRTVGIGLASTIEIGLGKFKIGATPRVRLLFTNSLTPSLP